jgi:hypothetical protein
MNKIVPKFAGTATLTVEPVGCSRCGAPDADYHGLCYSCATKYVEVRSGNRPEDKSGMSAEQKAFKRGIEFAEIVHTAEDRAEYERDAHHKRVQSFGEQHPDFHTPEHMAWLAEQQPLLTYDEVMDRLNDERSVKRDEVDPKALTRKVWVSGNGSPGCLYDNGPNYHRTKEDAIASCAFVFDEYKGVVTALRKYHRWVSDRGEMCEISESTINEIL